MKKAQGSTDDTKLRHAAMMLRGAYVENVRTGKCKDDPEALKEFDNALESYYGKGIHSKRK